MQYNQYNKQPEVLIPFSINNEQMSHSSRNMTTLQASASEQQYINYLLSR